MEKIEKHCKSFYIRTNRCSSLYNDIFALRGWKTEEINGIVFELNSILVEKWMHYIRNVVVERIVLENLKEVIRYVSNYEDEFVRMVMDADVRQKSRELAQKKKKLIELQKRIGELDTIFQRIYEDNITGKLSDERFMKMSKGYEDEQHTLQAEADKIQNELQQEEKKSVDVKRFLAIVKKYTDLTELTPEILREFVDKIIVHAPDKSSGRRLQEIEIIYNHIGEFDHSKVTLWKGNAV